MRAKRRGSLSMPADFCFELHVKAHTHFKREGDNLYHNMEIDAVEAICGIKRSLQSLDGKDIPILLPQLPSTGKCVLRGYGLPSQKGGTTGNLIVNFSVKYPTNLTNDEKEIIKRTLSTARARSGNC